MGLPIEKMAIADFIVWENAQQTKNEFYRGEVFAMVGVRRVHGRVAANLIRHLGNHLAGTACQVFGDSIKVQPAKDAMFYPDALVTCSKADLRAELVLRHPILVVEVLSPSTEAFDRSGKFAAYRQVAELREYVLIGPDTLTAEVFELIDQTGAPELVLDSVGLRLPMADVFDGVVVDTDDE
jgi:Uma2 family endonuclease